MLGASLLLVAINCALLLALWLTRDSGPRLFGAPTAGDPIAVIVVDKQGHHRVWTSGFKLGSDGAIELPPAERRVVETGFALASVPSGARAYLDDKPLAHVTPLRATDIDPGYREIKLEADGYEPWQTALYVPPGIVVDLPTARLVARNSLEVARRAEHGRSPSAPRRPPASANGGRTGTLRLQTRPWSKVFVNGRLVGSTPILGHRLPEGHHRVTFVNDDFGLRKSLRIELKGGQTTTRVLTLQ